MEKDPFKVFVHGADNDQVTHDLQQLTDAHILHIREGRAMRLGLVGHEAQHETEAWHVYEKKVDQLIELVDVLNSDIPKNESVQHIVHHRDRNTWRCLIFTKPGLAQDSWAGLDASLNDPGKVALALNHAQQDDGFVLKHTLQYRNTTTKQYHCVFLGIINQAQEVAD